MGYLQNCTITSYSAEEFAGDSYANETLESQTLPSGTGYTSSEAQALNSYFLKISPLPNYRIDSSMMTMGNLSWYADGEFSVLGTQIRKWETLNPGTLAAFGGYGALETGIISLSDEGEEHNLPGTMAKLWPGVFGPKGSVPLPERITTLDSDSPSVRKEKNR